MSSSPSIMLINRFYWPDSTGTAQMLADLAEDLAGFGWRVTVVTSAATYVGATRRLAATEERNGVRIIRIGSRFGRRGVARVLASVSFLVGAFWCVARLPRADVVVAMSDPPFTVAAALLAGRMRKARVVYWVQDLYPQIAARLGVMRQNGLAYRVIDALARAVTSRCDLVIALGPRMRDAVISAGARADRTTVVHNWADAKQIRPIAADANPFLVHHDLAGKFIVLYSGNAGRAHTFEAVIGAMERLRDDRDVMFVFIGGGPRFGSLRDTVQRHRFENVRFLEHQPRETLAASLSAASVALVTELPAAAGMLVPSKTYGILASGRPLVFIGSEDSDVADIVRSGECGFVVPPDRPDLLVAALETLRASAPLADAMGRKARAMAETQYDRALATRRWADAVGAVL